MSDLINTLPDDARQQATQSATPGWMDPMLATLTDDVFSDPDWIYERKLDGERCLAFRDGDSVQLLSRNQKSLNDTYPELVEALERQSLTRFVIDGEVVTFDGDVTSFERLQARMQIKDRDEARASDVPVYYYVFDIPHADGYDLTQVALRHRKAVLRKVFAFEDPLRFTPHRNEDGASYFDEVCPKGWEGLIAKDARSPYVHSRSKKWLKFKCVNRQEFVIGGYTDPHGSRIGFGALLIGYYDGDDLRYAGKVGTGYDDETLKRLSDRLESLERKTSPFATTPDEKGVHWVSPKLVGEVHFTEWTQDDKLRHPSFVGLRHDKDPHDVVRERPS